MAKLLLTVFSCLMIIACQQNTGSNAKNDLPNEINNTKLPTHINIPGTRVFLDPPVGFNISSKFKGIEAGNFTKIEVVDVNGENFYRTGDVVVCMQGVAGENEFEKYLEEFRKLTNTVRKKTK